TNQHRRQDGSDIAQMSRYQNAHSFTPDCFAKRKFFPGRVVYLVHSTCLSENNLEGTMAIQPCSCLPPGRRPSCSAALPSPNDESVPLESPRELLRTALYRNTDSI